MGVSVGVLGLSVSSMNTVLICKKVKLQPSVICCPLFMEFDLFAVFIRHKLKLAVTLRVLHMLPE